jgi:hypothetical protein
MHELGLNTTILKMAINGVHLVRDSIQHQDHVTSSTVLQDLDLRCRRSWGAGFLRSQPRHCTKIPSSGLDVTDNDLDDLVAAGTPGCFMENKTIT